ncbi:MAG TPA: Rrf2 family transcriptional regulator [Mycobacteriales bacterium]|nr:Rrf2 family transcriptional regulator [Mycobacteriales bacterium]
MRMSAKAEYATRAMAQLAAGMGGPPVRGELIAAAQGIPTRFLHGILGELRAGGLVRSHRGRSGGYLLARPADRITIADVIRCIDGPLASVRDLSLSEVRYQGPAAPLADVWMALRTSIRSVLEAVTLADLCAGELPGSVRELARTYRREQRRRHPAARER